MSLQVVLAEMDPCWHSSDTDGSPLEPALLARACASRLGRRLLGGELAAGHAEHLLAPSPDGVATLAARWTRERLAALHRDLGVLAYAPAIRAEIGRDAVRLLKAALGNSYLLALDRSVWDAKLAPAMQASLVADLRVAVAKGEAMASHLMPILDLQGRAELQAWASQREPALAEWARLLHPRDSLPKAVLPEKPFLVVHTHHQNRMQAE